MKRECYECTQALRKFCNENDKEVNDRECRIAREQNGLPSTQELYKKWAKEEKPSGDWLSSEPVKKLSESLEEYAYKIYPPYMQELIKENKELIASKKLLQNQLEEVMGRVDKQGEEPMGGGLFSEKPIEPLVIVGIEENDPVNHPAHYTSGKYEVIDVIEDWKLPYHLGNAVKYIARAGKKDPNKELEDLRKASWYLNRYIANKEQES